MPISTSDGDLRKETMSLSREKSLKQEARGLGFDLCGIVELGPDPEQERRFADFIADGRHGDMDWLAATQDRRKHAHALWPEARSALMLGMNYGLDVNPLHRLAHKTVGNISTYAMGRDYHNVIKGKLKRLASRLAAMTFCEVKVFVDTAPLMEKPLAQKAGIGWQGRHTNLVSRELGSWFFLGAVLTTARLVPDEPEQDHCGSCRACLDICPTRAFPAPYQLDARRCISYLTIEHKGHIDLEFREAMGNRIYGCDDCLAVCPWNKFARAASEAKLKARNDLIAPPLAELLALDDAAFRAKFTGSPVKRTGRNRFLRNVLIAAGNSADRRLTVPVAALLSDASPLVRAMAIWALSKLAAPGEFASLREKHAKGEEDVAVRQEWQRLPA
jgi:epoxyqueuosine reductase